VDISENPFRQRPARVFLAGMDAKKLAGEAALQFIQSGMVVGLGSGSTAKCFIEALIVAVRDGRLRDIRGIPTSIASEKLARDGGLTIVDFSQIEQIDVVVDGADEIAPDLTLIKGLGGALLREKLVAQNSKKMVIVADESKVVRKLGTKSPLPVEVIPFGRDASERFLKSLGCIPELRKKDDGSPYITDNGNHIFHCRFKSIDDPTDLNAKLGNRAGIVESGLFINLASAAIVAGTTDVRTITT
jgi:ribose 5-phosphate isomerase A